MTDDAFEKWKKRVAWTVGEAAYLLCGKEPPPVIRSSEDVLSGGSDVAELFKALKMAARSPRAPLFYPVTIDEAGTSIARPTAAPLPGFGGRTPISLESAPPHYWAESAAQQGFRVPERWIFLVDKQQTREQRDEMMLARREELGRAGHARPRKQVGKEFEESDENVKQAFKRAKERRMKEAARNASSAGGIANHKELDQALSASTRARRGK